MNNTLKKVAPILILAVLVASIFGFARMTHTNMNCNPSSPTSICPPSKIGMVFHHLSTYGNFIQAIISPLTKTAFSIILFLILAFIFIRYVLLNQIVALSRIYSRGNFKSSQDRKITCWLSLLENSPAV